MSDISLPFAGLLLVAAVAAGTALFGLIALVAALIARWRKSNRARTVARRAGLLFLVSAIMLAAVSMWWASSSPSRQDIGWVDWLSAPWLLFVVLGCCALARR